MGDSDLIKCYKKVLKVTGEGIPREKKSNLISKISNQLGKKKTKLRVCSVMGSPILVLAWHVALPSTSGELWVLVWHFATSSTPCGC